MQNGQFELKIKYAKNMRKTALRAHYSCSMQKNGSEKNLIFKKLEHFENGQKWPQCKGYSPCKMGSLG